MKDFKYKKYPLPFSIASVMEILERDGKDGWEMCGIVADHIILRKEWAKDIHIGLLKSCAYMRGVPNLQHRTIAEFAQFVEDVMKGNYPKYEFDWNSTDAIEIWIDNFHKYYKELQKSFEDIN